MTPSLKFFLFVLLLFTGVFNAYTIHSANYSVDSFHQGIAGAVANSTSFTSRSTLTHQQAGNINGSSTNFNVNVGWYNTSLIIFFYNITTSMVYPINGTTFQTQCSFLGQPNFTFSNLTNHVVGTCSLYLNGVFQDNKSVNLTESGVRNITFYNLVSAGNYSITCYATRPSFTSNTASAWANFWAMTACLVPQGITITNTSTNITYVYTPIVSPYVDVKTTLGILLAGIAIFGAYHYINEMWKIRKTS